MAVRSIKKKKGGKSPAPRKGRAAPPPPPPKPVEEEESSDDDNDDDESSGGATASSSSSEDDEVMFRGRKVENKNPRQKKGREKVAAKAEEDDGSTEAEDSDDDDDGGSGSTSTSSAGGGGGVDSGESPAKSEPAQRAKGRGGRGKDEDSSGDGDDDDDDDEEEEESSGSEEYDGDDDDGEDDEDGDGGGGGGGKHFSDENAAWLKPKEKQQLLSSDEEESGSDDDDAADDDEYGGGAAPGSDDDDDEEELLEVERQARAVDLEMEEERAEAEEELRRTIKSQTSVFHLPTPEELAEDEDRVVPPGELRERIDNVLEVLADFKARREPGRSRSEYTERLCDDMAELFGYVPELAEHFLSMLGPAECLEFLSASDRPRPLVIRTNTLKARRKDLAEALLKRGVTLDPLAPWSKVGLKIVESPVPIGATPEYLSGWYMVQSAASLCPVLALDPRPGERSLDMSAAPGGKTSYMAQLMRNTGVVVANDLKPERQKATVANLHRLGARNVVTCAHDGRKLGALWRGRFDRVLLDAPCSGLGVVSRDPSVKVRRTVADVRRTAVLQKELLLSAIDALNCKGRGGGIAVYSTCSVSVLENEEVVNYALSRRDVRVVETGLDFGKPGMTRYQQKRFHPSLALTRRFYPHVHNMDGFYVAKLRKLSNRRPGEEEKKNEDGENGEERAIETDEKKKKEKTTKGGTKRRAGDKDALKKGARAGEAPEEARLKHPNGKGKGKKRSRGQGGADAAGAEGGNPPPMKRSKNSKVSVPPPSLTQKSKKKKTNAKVTKPRQQKVDL